jgi:hypothetical protein
MADVPSLHISTAGASARRKAERLRQERRLVADAR